MKYIILLTGLMFLAIAGTAQEILSLSDAVKKTIEKNPSIQIQKFEMTRASNNLFKANVGAAPVVRAVAGGSYLSNYADVQLRTFQAEPEFINVDEFGVETVNGELGIQADYVVYDGGRRDTRFKLLQGLSMVERARQEVLINQTILAVSDLYTEIAKLQKQAAFIQQSIENGKARLSKMRDRKQFGQANSLDILRLQTALNQDEATFDDIKLVKANLIRDLNFLMGDELDARFSVEYDSDIPEIPELSVIQQAIEAENPQLQLSRVGIQVSESELQLAELDMRPTLGAFARVGYNYQRNDVQQLAEIQTAGVALGFNASYTLFDGGVRKNRTANSRIGLEKAYAEQQLTRTKLFNQALKEQSTYVLLRNQIEREQQNKVTFDEAFTKTQDLFLSGKVDNLALRDAELARQNVQLRIDELQADLTKSYWRLMLLMGNAVVD